MAHYFLTPFQQGERIPRLFRSSQSINDGCSECASWRISYEAFDAESRKQYLQSGSKRQFA